MTSSKTKELWEHNSKFIPGGLVSINRATNPMTAFARAKGAYLWDLDGKKYIDYHAAFSPYLLGHGDDDVDNAVISAIRSGQSLSGAGTTSWEGELAELIVEAVPGIDQIELVNSGSEATSYAIRLARAVTGRDQVLLMQGGYNGWHDDVAYNLMDAWDRIKDHQPGTPHELRPFSTGISSNQKDNIVVAEYNDIEAVEYLLKTRKVAALITEPILQNVGIVKPKPGFLEGLRNLCDQYGTILIFDEVKTGFRHALGGYQSICGVMPDLCTFGKAVANGYPLGVLGGKQDLMQLFADPDLSKRVLLGGTYNGHPVPVAAATETIRKLKERGKEIYGKLEALGSRMQVGLQGCFKETGIQAQVVRQSSAFVVYFMDHNPVSWSDIAEYLDMDFDHKYRKALIEQGIFHFPQPTKQGSISFAHSETDIDQTLEITQSILKHI